MTDSSKLLKVFPKEPGLKPLVSKDQMDFPEELLEEGFLGNSFLQQH